MNEEQEELLRAVFEGRVKKQVRGATAKKDQQRRHGPSLECRANRCMNLANWRKFPKKRSTRSQPSVVPKERLYRDADSVRFEKRRQR
jgi:hypothetical protein